MNEKRGPLYLLTGLLLGLAVGVLISQLILPVNYTDTEPATLRPDQREVFRSMVARAFLMEADVNRARSRLDLLQDAAPVEELIAQAQNLLATSGDQQSARAMALLAASFSQPNLMITPLPPKVTPVATVTPTLAVTASLQPVTVTPGPTKTAQLPTATPSQGTAVAKPSSTLQPTEGSPFKLVSNDPVCTSADAAPLLQVIVLDSQGNPLAGVKIEITLVNAAPTYFYTGLYPEYSAGYADYLMQKDTNYNLRVGDGGQLVTGLQAPSCGEGGSAFTGGLKLVFQQP
ncbi:hypothetical protein EG834_09405 [bacterium]|nr:hypothetical protein [bacterium]